MWTHFNVAQQIILHYRESFVAEHVEELDYYGCGVEELRGGDAVGCDVYVVEELSFLVE